MIDVRHLADHPDDYRRDITQRGLPTKLVDDALAAYIAWKAAVTHAEALAEERNKKSAGVPTLAQSVRPNALAELKQLSERIKEAQAAVDNCATVLDELIPRVPILCWQGVPVGKSEKDNVVRSTSGHPPTFGFTPRPYFELPLCAKWIATDEGVKAFGSRGYYLRGPIARLQKALFDYVLHVVESSGFELFYPPVLLNRETLTATGHLPDFEGQQYEVALADSQAAYLIGSSEPTLMAFYRDKTAQADQLPIRMTSWTSCFRKEAGSYGKDQRGVIRNHQFEKIEMVILCDPLQSNERLEELEQIERSVYDALGLHYREVEICTSDLPKKHCRQIDFEAWFPGQDKYIEISSNGNAGDYQTRSLNIRMIEKGSKRRQIPHSLNCTGVTFRTGLAIIEQFQRVDGSVVVPQVIQPYLKADTIGP